MRPIRRVLSSGAGRRGRIGGSRCGRHHDHIVRFADGGATTVFNGRGLCERGNYVRELPGWTVRLVDSDSHTVQTTTPTGHSHLSRPDEPP